ncbi:YeaC family protein [Thalassotalea aquiviva]|uniref:YeaC family protein n=1 Tax=Thalassotalea aquiviva TaxID=3242415 RepID=UPI00352BA79A
MDILAVVDSMSEQMYLRLKSAAETGKWPEGTDVGIEQRESALQLTMAYQARHLNNQDNMTIGADGHIVTKTKAELRNQFKQPDKNKDDIARFSDL